MKGFNNLLIILIESLIGINKRIIAVNKNN